MAGWYSVCVCVDFYSEENEAHIGSISIVPDYYNISHKTRISLL